MSHRITNTDFPFVLGPSLEQRGKKKKPQREQNYWLEELSIDELNHTSLGLEETCHLNTEEHDLHTQGRETDMLVNSVSDLK